MSDLRKSPHSMRNINKSNSKKKLSNLKKTIPENIDEDGSSMKKSILNMGVEKGLLTNSCFKKTEQRQIDEESSASLFDSEESESEEDSKNSEKFENLIYSSQSVSK